MDDGRPVEPTSALHRQVTRLVANYFGASDTGAAEVRELYDAVLRGGGAITAGLTFDAFMRHLALRADRASVHIIGTVVHNLA